MAHCDLARIYAQFKSVSDLPSFAAMLLSLLETFEVCFVIQEDIGKPFMEQRSVVLIHLPEHRADHLMNIHNREFTSAWPQDATFRQPTEMERTLVFNVLPVELVSRLLVSLHSMIQGNLVRRDDTQAWVHISVPENSLTVSLRGVTPEACIKLMARISKEVSEDVNFCVQVIP